jgi:glycosyltransferase involved in cell wall biosynthesis
MKMSLKLLSINILIVNCIIISRRKSGGTERRLIEVVKNFNASGVTPHIVEFYRYSLDYGGFGQINRVKRLFPEGLIGDLLRVLYLTPIILRIGLKNKVNAIYMNRSDVTDNLLQGFIVSRIMRKPLVLICHDLPRYRKLSLRKMIPIWRKRGVDLKLLFSHIFNTIIKRTIHERADLGLAVSKETERQVKKFVNPHVYYSGNGIDVKRFRPDNSLPKSFDAIYFGRIEKYTKNIDTLLNCWRIVLDEFPKAKLILAGDGSENYVLHCKKIVKNLSMTKNVIFSGWVSDKEAVRLLNSSKIFLLSSKWEGFGLAVAEAMACGLCCVISNLPVLKETFQDAADFVEPDNYQGFAERVIYYLKNESERKRMGEKAYEFSKKFDWKTVAENEAILIKTKLRNN